MAADESDTGQFVSSIHRTLLGALLAVVGLVGIGGLRAGVTDGNLPIGTGGLVLTVIAAVWIASLFLEGVRER